MSARTIPDASPRRLRRPGFFSWALVVVLFMLVVEICLRVFGGFCSAVLYREDPAMEYIAVPQDTRRLGNHIFYNSFSQRNPEPRQDEILIDGFGDSVLNGGSQSDNDSLATTKLSNYLTQELGRPVRVLNISCQSWGPDNCFAYLQHYGDFGAKAFFLVLSSHDIFDLMDFDPVVGVNSHFPERQYRLAWFELFGRYVIPKITGEEPVPAPDGINKHKPGTKQNPGILALYRYAKERGLPFLVYHHAEVSEYLQKRYNRQGLILDSLCEANRIPLVKELDHDIGRDAYRDNIHLTSRGQEQLFRILKDRIYKHEAIHL